MKAGSSAVIRYLMCQRTPRTMRVEAEGNRELAVMLNGKTLENAQIGLNEVKLTATGELTVHSVCFLSE